MRRDGYSLALDIASERIAALTGGSTEAARRELEADVQRRAMRLAAEETGRKLAKAAR